MPWKSVPVNELETTTPDARVKEGKRDYAPPEESSVSSGQELREGPYLVQGMTGNGKTAVLANQLARTADRNWGETEGAIWVVYAHEALDGRLKDALVREWNREGMTGEVPWERIRFKHVAKLLQQLEERFDLESGERFAYEQRAEQILEAAGEDGLESSCEVLFVDEAEDLGHTTLDLLVRLVRPRELDGHSEKRIMISYDPIPNIYGREQPRWEELDLDLQDRSAVLRRNHRSTKQIQEYALNVLARLRDLEVNSGVEQLSEEEVIEKVNLDGGPEWWKVNGANRDGPVPDYKVYGSLEEIMQMCAGYISRLVQEEGISPSEIKIVYNGENIRTKWLSEVQQELEVSGVEILDQKGEPFTQDEHTIVASTPQSMKGYSAEVVIVLAAEQFYSMKQDRVLADSLYVALTRARTRLMVFEQVRDHQEQLKIIRALRETKQDQERLVQLEGG